MRNPASSDSGGLFVCAVLNDETESDSDEGANAASKRVRLSRVLPGAYTRPFRRDESLGCREKRVAGLSVGTSVEGCRSMI